ncbi:hypothetical protein [Lentzea sp. CA-135723]|uniref:hypothetical protein n=1 Tax=Lentzea sp. CA-135723 TaxID=3239950 RepID=UPI003D8C118B
MLLAAGGALIMIHRKWKKWKKWWVVAILTALTSAFFADTSLGSKAAQLLSKILSWPAGKAEVPTASIAAVLTLLVLAGIIYALRDKSTDRPEIIAMFFLPLLFIISSGPVADGGATLTEAFRGYGSQGLGYLIGA